jgi:flagellar hook-basal body complex protein FliE
MGDPIQLPGLGPSRVELDPLPPRVSRSAAQPADGKAFKDVLAEAVGEVQRLQTEADTTIKQLVAGEIKDVSDAMVAVEKADVAFQTMMVVRNKMVAAYEEIMRMQV